MAGEKLSYEIAAIYSGSPAVKAAFDDFAKLNVQGQRVVNQLNGLAKQAQNTGEALRNSRQGTAQLGMQFNQFATQVAGGTSPLLAMQQQLGDVGYAMSHMKGVAGAVGGFLAGPWGALIIAGSAMLAPLIAKAFETKDAMNAMGDASKNAIDQLYASLRQASLMSNALDNVAKKRIAALGDEAKANEDLKNAEADLAAMRGTFGITPESMAPIVQRAAAAESRLKIARKTLKDTNDELQQVQSFSRIQEMQNANAARLENKADNIPTRSGGSTSARSNVGKAASELAKYQDQIYVDGLRRAYNFNEAMLKMAEDTAVGFATPMEKFDALVETINTDINARILKPAQELEAAYRSVGQAVDDAFKNMLTAGGSWRDGMRSIIQSVIDQLWKMYVTQQIVGFITNTISGAFSGGASAGGSGITVGNMSTGVAGMLASGGYAQANNPYIVGENGPELFVPGSSGTVIPNGKTMNAIGGSGGVVVNVDARGSADPAAVRAQVQQGILEAAPAIIQAAQNRTISTMRRPKLGGVMQ